MSIQTSMQKLWKHKVVRFACVGTINTLTDLTLLNVFVFALGIRLLIANAMSASISITISYFWNHIVVFQRQHPRTWGSFIKFVVITGLSILAVQTVIIYGVQHVVSIDDLTKMAHISVAQARFVQVNGAKVVAVLGGMTWNFFLYHMVVFKHPKPVSEIEDEGVIPY